MNFSFGGHGKNSIGPLSRVRNILESADDDSDDDFQDEQGVSF
jgi:hypothetical protein